MKRSELIFNVLLVPVDIAAILLAGLAAFYLRVYAQSSGFLPSAFELSLSKLLEVVVLTIPVFLIFMGIFGLYSMHSVRKFWWEILRILGAVTAAFMFLIVVIFFSQNTFPSRFIFVTMWLICLVIVSFERVLMRYVQGRIVKRYDYGVHHLVLVGRSSAGEKIEKEIKLRPAVGYRLTRRLKDVDLHLLAKIHKGPGIDEIFLVSSEFSNEKVAKLIEFCQDCGIIFKFVPDAFQAQAALFEMETLSDVTLIEVKRTPLDGWGKVFKRAMDVVCSSLGLLVLSPFFLLVAIAIKLDSKGPVFARLERMGKEKPFSLFKFRSMVDGAHRMKYNSDGTMREEFQRLNERGEGPLFKLHNDPRVTRVGKFIRKTRIDEFAQLINVLKGEMSLVGPRPHEPQEVARYAKHHRKVFTIKPGITGMAQVSGSSDLSFEREIQLDVYYIENWTLLLDVIILFKTFYIFLKGDKAAC